MKVCKCEVPERSKCMRVCEECFLRIPMNLGKEWEPEIFKEDYQEKLGHDDDYREKKNEQ